MLRPKIAGSDVLARRRPFARFLQRAVDHLFQVGETVEFKDQHRYHHSKKYRVIKHLADRQYEVQSSSSGVRIEREDQLRDQFGRTRVPIALPGPADRLGKGRFIRDTLIRRADTLSM